MTPTRFEEYAGCDSLPPVDSDLDDFVVELDAVRRAVERGGLSR